MRKSGLILLFAGIIHLTNFAQNTSSQLQEEMEVINDLLPQILLDIERTILERLNHLPPPPSKIIKLSDDLNLDYKVAEYSEYRHRLSRYALARYDPELKNWLRARNEYNKAADSIRALYRDIAIINELKSNSYLVRDRKYINLTIQEEDVKISDAFFSTPKETIVIDTNLIQSLPFHIISFEDPEKFASPENRHHRTLEFTRVIFDDSKKEAGVYVRSAYTDQAVYGTLYILKKNQFKWDFKQQYFFIKTKSSSVRK